MAKFKWTLPEVYEVLQTRGLSGLLQEFCEIRDTMQGGMLEDAIMDMAKESYDMLNDQIMSKVKKTGTLFFLMSSATKQPYIDCYDLETDFRSYLFSEAALAERFQEELRKHGYATEVVEILTGRRRSDYFNSMMLAGVNYLVLNPGDYQYPILISQLTDLPSYDGFRDLNHPLVNCKMNALLSEYIQDMETQSVVPELEKELFREMKDGYFALPAVIDGEVDRLDHKEIMYKYSMLQRENTEGGMELCMPVFTDYENIRLWLNQMGLENHTSVIVPFSEFFHLMDVFGIKSFVVNWNSFALILSPTLLSEIRMAE